MTTLQTGLKRPKDMTLEERELHYRTLFYKADDCVRAIGELLDMSDVDGRVRVELESVLAEYSE